MAIEEILDLEQLEVNIYRGGVFSSESGFLQRTFGGHVAGQSLVSAVRTVDPKFQVHSLHGYFLRPGDARAPSVYLVERIRDGGSFATRRVSADPARRDHLQHVGVVPDRPERYRAPGRHARRRRRPTTSPASRSAARHSTTPASPSSTEWDVRIVPRDQVTLLPGKASQQQVWFRHRDPLPDDPVLHICALAYLERPDAARVRRR